MRTDRARWSAIVAGTLALLALGLLPIVIAPGTGPGEVAEAPDPAAAVRMAPSAVAAWQGAYPAGRAATGPATEAAVPVQREDDWPFEADTPASAADPLTVQLLVAWRADGWVVVGRQEATGVEHRALTQVLPGDTHIAEVRAADGEVLWRSPVRLDPEILGDRVVDDQGTLAGGARLDLAAPLALRYTVPAADHHIALRALPHPDARLPGVELEQSGPARVLATR